LAPEPEVEPQLIDLREFFSVLRRRGWSVGIVTLVVVALALGLVAVRTPAYTSNAQVEVRPLSAGVQLGAYATSFVNMDTEAQRVKSESVVRAAARTLGEPANTAAQVDTISRHISASVAGTTTFLNIACTQLTPERAQHCADAFSKAYVADRQSTAQLAYDAARNGPLDQIKLDNSKLRTLNTQLRTATGAERATIFDQIDSTKADLSAAELQLMQVPTPSPTAAIVSLSPGVPLAPSNKGYITTGILALLLGMALGVGLAFARERLDERVTGRDQFEAAIGAPVLAVIPSVTSWRKPKEEKLVSLAEPGSAAAEAYRTARTTLSYLADQDGLQVLAIAGPGQNEGKTTTAANVAVSLAQAGNTVVAVSCDLRKPRLHRFFGLENDAGLTDVLSGRVSLKAATQSTLQPNLLVLASGTVPPNPAEMLTSKRMDELLNTLREAFDFVILDTAPALVVSDALVLAPKSDGIIVVCDASKTTRAAATQMRHQLHGVGGRVIGGILNNLDPAIAKRYPGYGPYYRYADKYGYRQEPALVSQEGLHRKGRADLGSNGFTDDSSSQPEEPTRVDIGEAT
jgi:capsular exopolysaccharide synthesis family protein